MTPEQQQALRAPFDKVMVGKLPKPYKKDSPKGKCPECDGWHGLPAMHLDFVGHGAVTDRLLAVDPEWNWEPLAFTTDGFPAVDRSGHLWIKLTIGGVTRLGVGDGQSMKEIIGDAIRNAAMRFGVALDLWINGSEDEKTEVGDNVQPTPEPDPPAIEYATSTQIKAIKAACQDLTDEQRAKLVDWPTVYGVTLVKDKAIAVTATQADDVLTSLKAAVVGQQEPVDQVAAYAVAGEEPF